MASAPVASARDATLPPLVGTGSSVSVSLDVSDTSVIFDLVIPRSGKYPFVDHSMRDMQIGAAGTLNVMQ